MTCLPLRCGIKWANIAHRPRCWGCSTAPKLLLRSSSLVQANWQTPPIHQSYGVLFHVVDSVNIDSLNIFNIHYICWLFLGQEFEPTYFKGGQELEPQPAMTSYCAALCWVSWQSVPHCSVTRLHHHSVGARVLGGFVQVDAQNYQTNAVLMGGSRWINHQIISNIFPKGRAVFHTTSYDPLRPSVAVGSPCPAGRGSPDTDCSRKGHRTTWWLAHAPSNQWLKPPPEITWVTFIHFIIFLSVYSTSCWPLHFIPCLLTG